MHKVDLFFPQDPPDFYNLLSGTPQTIGSLDKRGGGRLSAILLELQKQSNSHDAQIDRPYSPIAPLLSSPFKRQ